MYADDPMLSPSVIGLQHMLDKCYEFGQSHDIIFNVKKSVCLKVGFKHWSPFDNLHSDMFIGDQKQPWVAQPGGIYTPLFQYKG